MFMNNSIFKVQLLKILSELRSFSPHQISGKEGMV